MKIKLTDGSSATIERGDFVNLDEWFGDVWAEVLDLFDSDPRHRSLVLAGGEHKSVIVTVELEGRPRVRKVHGFDVRFTTAEARIVRLCEGVVGETKNKHGRSLDVLPERLRPILPLPTERATCASCDQPGFPCDDEGRLLAHPVALPAVVPPHRRAVWHHAEHNALVCSSCRRAEAQGLKVIIRSGR